MRDSDPANYAGPSLQHVQYEVLGVPGCHTGIWEAVNEEGMVSWKLKPYFLSPRVQPLGACMYQHLFPDLILLLTVGLSQGSSRTQIYVIHSRKMVPLSYRDHASSAIQAVTQPADILRSIAEDHATPSLQRCPSGVPPEPEHPYKMYHRTNLFPRIL